MELTDLGGFLGGGTVIKNLPATAGDARSAGSILGLGCFPGVVNGNPLQYSFLENSMQRSLVGYCPWDHKDSDMTEQVTLSLTFTSESSECKFNCLKTTL